mgnify:CR=1 FL=1
MRLATRSALVLVLAASAALAHQGVKNPAVMERMEGMTDQAAAMKTLGQMATGKTAFDAAAAAAAREEVMRLALEVDGTVSGEHGIGSVNRRYLEMELDREAMALTRGVKKLLDPATILNPGKIF